MKNLRWLTLFVLLSFVPVAQGQNTNLPNCSAAQLTMASSMQKDFDPLLFAGADIESLDDLLSFGAAHIVWRDAMWAQLSLCNEVFKLGLMLDQLSEALFMRLTLRSVGVADDDNPYSELGIDSAKEINRLNDVISEASTDSAATLDQGGGLRACSGDERLMMAGNIWTSLANLLDTAYAVDSFDALLNYIDLKLEWGAEIWSQLPPCEEAYEIVTWMYRYSSDMAKIYMIDLFGVKRAANPYDEMYLEGLIQFSAYAQWVETAGTDYSSLPSCAETNIGGNLYESLTRHQELTDVPHSSVEKLPGFSAAHIEWRDSLWAALPSLPGCREAFESALLSLQITGDATTVSALTTTGIGLLELGSAYQERVVSAGIRIGELNRALRVDKNAQIAETAVALAQCSENDLGILFDDLQGFVALQEKALEMQTADDLITYIQALFEWRDMLWTALPGCAEAFEIAALMIQSAGDYASSFALEKAGVPADANPFVAQLDRGIEEIFQWHAHVWTPIEGVVVTPASTTTYYVDANGSAILRTCAASDCEIVGVAADGEALDVVADKGDWYEVYIGAGTVGYIPKELLSSDPPAEE